MESARTLDLHCKVSEGLGILQLHKRVYLHHETRCPCPYRLEGITIFADRYRGRERAVCSDREDLQRWKGTMVDLSGQGGKKLRNLVENMLDKGYTPSMMECAPSSL